MNKVLVILGSTREKRNGEKVANWFMSQVDGKFPEMEFELADLKELDLPWFNSAISPSFADKKYDDPKVQAWSKKVESFDAFVIVAAEYNHGYTAPLKNALDLLHPEWHNKPVTFLSYGGAAAGARAVEQLRQVVIELEMAPIRTGIHIAKFGMVFDDKGEITDPSYLKQVEPLVKQLQWWTQALKAAREKK